LLSGAGEPDVFAVDDASGGTLLGWAALVTAVGGVIGILGGLIAQLRKTKPGMDPPEHDDPDRGALWMQMLEQLEAANERAGRIERELASCNRERLALLRDAAKGR
jgi:hypothetical protein